MTTLQHPDPLLHTSTGAGVAATLSSSHRHPPSSSSTSSSTLVNNDVMTLKSLKSNLYSQFSSSPVLHQMKAQLRAEMLRKLTVNKRSSSTSISQTNSLFHRIITHLIIDYLQKSHYDCTL